jgi:hypothetical protein
MGDGSGGDEVAGHLFRVDITEVVLTRIGDPQDHLAVSVWTPEKGLRQLKTQ